MQTSLLQLTILERCNVSLINITLSTHMSENDLRKTEKKKKKNSGDLLLQSQAESRDVIILLKTWHSRHVLKPVGAQVSPKLGSCLI